MFRTLALTAFAYLAVVSAQQVGTLQSETHPRITVQQCSAGGSCTSQTRPIVLDSNWRWTHITSSYTNCYTGNEWNSTVCPDGATCARVSRVPLFCFHQLNASSRIVRLKAQTTAVPTVSPQVVTKSVLSS